MYLHNCHYPDTRGLMLHVTYVACDSIRGLVCPSVDPSVHHIQLGILINHVCGLVTYILLFFYCLSESLQREMFKTFNLDKQAKKRKMSYILRLAEL